MKLFRIPLLMVATSGLLGVLLLAAAPSPQPTSQPSSMRVPTSVPTQARSHDYGVPPRATAQWSIEFLQKIPVPPVQVGSLKGLVLVYTGGLKSYIEPCGCQADMLGGLARVSSLLRAYLQQGMQLAIVDAGNLFFEELENSAAKQAQSALKAEAMADLFRLMGGQVMGVGPYDLVLGTKTLQTLVQRSGMVALASNLIDRQTRKPIFPGHHVVTVGGKRLGFFALTETPEIPVGLSDEEKKDKQNLYQHFWSKRQLEVLPTEEAARREIAALQKKRVDLIVLLSTLGSRRLQALVSRVKGISLAVEGDEDNEYDPPQEVGTSFLLSTPKEGHKLGVFAMFMRAAEMEWSPVETPAKRKETLADMRKQVVVYNNQAAQMMKQGADFAPIAQVYEKQARDMEKKIEVYRKQVSAPPSLAEGRNGYFHLLLPVSSKLPDLPAALARVDRYQEEVKQANLLALEKIKPVLKDQSGNFYMGGETCRACHAPAYEFWSKTAHAHAYATLVKKGKQFDLDCIGCHVVGWQQPGGLYDIKKPERLANVQCENCHSRGALHVQRGGLKKWIVGEVGASVCVQCHKGSHHPNFNFLVNVKKILGKGHGEKRLTQILAQEKKK